MEMEATIYHNNYTFRTEEERSAEESAIDDWIPVSCQTTTTAANKWWYSAVHNITVIVGAGILALPRAMAYMGWGPGITFLGISWIVTLYTLWQMVELHEIVPGKHFKRYHELGQYAFGEKLGLWIIVPQQLIVVVGVNIVYMITAGECLKKFHNLVCKNCRKISLTYCILIFASVHFLLSQLRTLNSIVRISLAATIMTVCYSTITWSAALQNGVQKDVEYGYKSTSPMGNVLDFFSALGVVVFSYSAHNVVIEIKASMASTPNKPSKGPMWRGALVAYVVVALCYFPVALIGYGMYGNGVGENILTFLGKPTWLVAMGNLFLVLHLVGSYQVFAMPVFDMMEIVLENKLKLKQTWYLRFLSRNIYVGLTTFLAIKFPFFGGILGLIGGFGFAPTTYFIPCILWIAIQKPKKLSPSWFANWGCIFFGVAMMILAPIGGVRQFILSAQ